MSPVYFSLAEDQKRIKMKSDLSVLMHQCGKIDPGRAQFFHDSGHISVGIVIGSVFTDGCIQEIIVGGIYMGLPVSDLSVFIGADKTVGKEIHKYAVGFPITSEMRLPCYALDPGEAFKINGFPVIEFH